MAQPAAIVVGPQYCCPYSVDIAFVKEAKTIADANFAITDMKGNVLFKIKEKVPSLKRKTILDAAGNPITTLVHKGASMHSRWQAYRGQSTDPKDLLFNAKVHSLFYWKMKVDVFLANNKAEKVCDFKVKGSFSKHSSVIYAGDDHSNTIVAQAIHSNMNQRTNAKKEKSESSLLGKNDFMVTVSANTDYAFIAALIVIVQDINFEEQQSASAASSASSSAVAAVASC